jgi:peptidoglycan hydrolase FlgJ
MPCGVQVITGIPGNLIGGIEAAALLDQPTQTMKQATGNGEWTLTIVFPPCDDGSDPLTHANGPGGAPVAMGSAATSPGAFVQAHLADAQKVKQQCSVPIAVTLAQSALETGWGRSVVGNAYFGIKARPDQQSVVVGTHEYEGGVCNSTSAAFCAYANYAESALAYGTFLAQNPRYSAAFQHVDNPEAFAQAVATAGYATDPHYGDKLVALMRANGLEQFDRV